jgi:hypothetical protein
VLNISLNMGLWLRLLTDVYGTVSIVAYLRTYVYMSVLISSPDGRQYRLFSFKNTIA